jgi:hypothetical protein
MVTLNAWPEYGASKESTSAKNARYAPVRFLLSSSISEYKETESAINKTLLK